MQRIKGLGALPGLAAVFAMALMGCAAKSPLEQLVENRSRYSAEVNSFYVDEVPVEMPAEVEEEAEGEEATEPESDEPMEESPVEMRQRVTLDLLVKHDSAEKLPGVTVDVTMADANGNEKGSWLVWVDTANVERANPTAYEHIIEDVDFVEGDGFFAEVRHPIAESERGDYQEFSSVGS